MEKLEGTRELMSMEFLFFYAGCSCMEEHWGLKMEAASINVRRPGRGKVLS